MCGVTSTFQRARRPEQLAARRCAILAAARTALADRRVDEVTLRDISEGVGLAKSNVLRYFDSREAIFLELLDEECRDWLAELGDALGRPRARKPGYTNEIRIATTIAETLAARRLMCELLGAMAGYWNATSRSSSPATSSCAPWRTSPRSPNWSARSCPGCPRSSPASSARRS